jgi:hypothetical protein
LAQKSPCFEEKWYWILKLFHAETVSFQTTYTVIGPTYVKNWCPLHACIKQSAHTVCFCVSLQKFYKYGKVIFSFSLINGILYYEDIWGSGGTAPTLSSTLYGSEWTGSRPGRFTPGNEPAVPIGYICINVDIYYQWNLWGKESRLVDTESEPSTSLSNSIRKITDSWESLSRLKLTCQCNSMPLY